MSTADKEFHTLYEETDKMRYCVSSICGYRPSNEDAHVAEIDIGDGNSFFGIFDGHGV